MTKEQIYQQQLETLGIWDPAFKPEVHDLAVMERELTRMLKSWKGEDADPTSDLFKSICSMRRDILAHRDALGLTPKALQRLKGKTSIEINNAGTDPMSQRLDAIFEKVSSYE